MTCFWDGILKSLKKDDFDFIGEIKETNYKFVELLKKRTLPMRDVLWQGQKISEREIQEHLNAINDYDINNISNGHLTSTCDSFLLLICQLFYVDIIHYYMNHEIYYKYNGISRKTLRFSSSNGHFVCLR